MAFSTEQSTELHGSIQPKIPVTANNSGWLHAFTEIWQGIGRTLKHNPEHWRKVAATGVLIWLAVFVLSLYAQSLNEGIRAENMVLMQVSMSSADREELVVRGLHPTEFAMTAALQTGIARGVLKLLSQSLLFWGCFALIGGGVNFRSTTGTVGAGMIISASGLAIATLTQILGSGLRYAPNLGIIVNPQDRPWIFSFLANIGIFTAWEYVALGMALAYIAHYRPKVGVIVGVFAYVTYLAYTGLAAWLGNVMAGR